MMVPVTEVCWRMSAADTTVDPVAETPIPYDCCVMYPKLDQNTPSTWYTFFWLTPIF